MKRAGVGEAVYADHAAAVASLAAALPRVVECYSEAKLRSNLVELRALSVDLLLVDRPQGLVVGFEVKPSFYKMSEYARAIKQASDHRHGLLCDPRLPELDGRRLNASFVFPRWGGGHDELGEYAQEAKGMEILAHHLRVGFAEIIAGGLMAYANEKIAFQHGVWTSKGHELFQAKDQVGSLKNLDPSKGLVP